MPAPHLSRRVRGVMLTLALALTSAGVAGAATRSPNGGEDVIAGPHRDAAPAQSGVALDQPPVTEASTSTTLGAPTTLPPHSVTTAHPSTHTVTQHVEPGPTIDQPGVWVVDTETGQATRATDPGPFDVVGQTLYWAHGTTVFAAPVAGGTPAVKYDVAGPELKWLEMSPDGHALAERVQPTPNGFSYVYSTLIGPDGVPIVRDVGGIEVAWARDGSFFVVVAADGQSVTGFRPDGSTLWGPVSNPIQFVKDVDVSPDMKHVLLTTDQSQTPNPPQYAFALDIASLQWSSVPNVEGQASFMADGTFAADATRPATSSGFDLVGCVTSDLAGHTTVLTKEGLEPVMAPNGTQGVVLAPDGKGERLMRRDGTFVLTLAHTGWRVGRDEERGDNPQGSWMEGPRWSADSRYVVLGFSA